MLAFVEHHTAGSSKGRSSTDGRMLELPENLQQDVCRYLSEWNLSQGPKRFAAGLLEEDCRGFFVGDRPLSDFPEVLADLEPPPPPSGHTLGAMAPPSEGPAWEKIANRIYQHFFLLMARPDGASLVNHVCRPMPGDSTLTFPGSGLAHGRMPMPVCPFVKLVSNEEKQWDFYRRLETDRRELARFFVPMTGFVINDRFSVMICPFLENYVTLSDLLIDVCLSDESAGEALKPTITQAVRFIAAFYEVGKGVRGREQVPVVDHIRRKLKTRLDNEERVLLGPILHKRLSRMAGEILESQLSKLTTGDDEQTQLAAGHGDLNASNILVSSTADRSSANTVDFRLIDPSPSGFSGDLILELGRLLHWIELAVPMKLAEQWKRDDTGFTIRFDTYGDSHPLDRPLSLTLHERASAALTPVYQHLLHCLREMMPVLTQPNNWAKLSLAVATYHLVGAGYWKRNWQRSAAYLAAIDELLSLDPGRRNEATAVSATGLWDARRSMARTRQARRSS